MVVLICAVAAESVVLAETEIEAGPVRCGGVGAVELPPLPPPPQALSQPPERIRNNDRQRTRRVDIRITNIVFPLTHCCIPSGRLVQYPLHPVDRFATERLVPEFVEHISRGPSLGGRSGMPTAGELGAMTRLLSMVQKFA